MLLVVENIDPATDCWIEQKQLFITDLDELINLLALKDFQLCAVFELTPAELDRVASAYGFAFETKGLTGILVVFDRQDFFPEHLHTGRELLLMLAGSKPLAAFVDSDPPTGGISVIPEAFFDPYVEAGRFTKKVAIIETQHTGRIRYVLYALGGEEWRMDSYLMLWALGEHYGWNPGFEKIEGYLLGYEVGIDPFFNLPNLPLPKPPNHI